MVDETQSASDNPEYAKMHITTAAQLLGQRGGKSGGKSTSEAKKSAARENGKKGGRPRKPKPDAGGKDQIDGSHGG